MNQRQDFLQDYWIGLHYIVIPEHSIHDSLSYLNQPVLRSEPGVVCSGSWVQGADVLSGPGSVTVEVEAVARLRPHKVAQTWNELRWVDLGP